MLPLFQEYPTLRAHLAHVLLAELPTPVVRLTTLESHLGLDQLYVKRDDLSGPVYGGNKIRKLEFLLADAVSKRHREVLTFGCVGSNHALATAIYASSLNMRSLNVLLPQPNAAYVQRNLLLSYRYGADLRVYTDEATLHKQTARLIEERKDEIGSAPYIIPFGGSSPLGTVGFVNAAFELANQVRDGLVPEPDVIYVATGSMGTAAGLMLGLKAVGLKTRVVPVRVVGDRFTNAKSFRTLYAETAALLANADPGFHAVPLRDDEPDMRHDFYGEEYARFTPEGNAAVRRLRTTEGITLEGTYTGKAFAALLADVEAGKLKDQVVLFWNTYNSRDMVPLILDMDYHNLPVETHRFFEESLQPEP